MDRQELRELAKRLRQNANAIDKLLGPPDGLERGCYWPVDDSFQYGTRVQTTVDACGHDWTHEAQLERKWGVEGTVIDRSDSHGLCYHVRHADGSDGWYDPAELQKS